MPEQKSSPYINTPFFPHEKNAILTMAENEGRSAGKQVRELVITNQKLVALLSKRNTSRVLIRSKKKK